MSRERVEKELKGRIRGGTYEPGERLPSERELATEFGVSRSTIQSALRNLCSAGLLIHERNCRPVVAERKTDGLPDGAAKRSIAVWIQPNLEDIGAAMILQGIRSATERRGFSLVVGFPATNRREEYQEGEVQFLNSLVTQPDVAGAIVWETCAPRFPTVFPALSDVGIPLVFVDREPPEAIDADVVTTNNRRGAQKAVAHLIRLGHRDIAMIANSEPASSVRDRIEGYRDALQAGGIPFRPELLLTYDNDKVGSELTDCVRFLRPLFCSPNCPTAVFVVNDGLALWIEQAMGLMERELPYRISLVGFDWLLRSMPGGGHLTTVAQPFEAIGRIAAERLLERITDSSPEPTRHILLEAQLVVKATCGPPRSEL